MNIAFIVPGFSKDADDWAIPALQTLFTTLAREHRVHVFSLRYPMRGRYQFQGVTHHATGGGTQFQWASLAIIGRTVTAIRRQHQETPFDLLHAFWADESGLAAIFASRVTGRPVLVSLGGGELTHLPEIGYGTQRSQVRRVMIRLVLRSADYVTAGSLYQADLARQHGVTEARLRLAPLGIDGQQFRPARHCDWARPTLIQAASLHPVKNQRLLLDIVRRLRPTFPGLRLRLAGDGPLREELLQLAEEMGTARHVVWHRQMRYPDMPRFYQKADLYVQTSYHESQGMAVLEALASGTPVVGTPVGVLPEVSCQPPAWDAAALAATIQRVLQDATGYDAMRREARRLFEANYELSLTVGRFLLLYQALLKA